MLFTKESTLQASASKQTPACVVSRSTSLQREGFSSEVADRIAAPQRPSTRAIYASKWSVFHRWCTEQQVDIRNPTISDICSVLLHLFQDKNRSPSAIEGCRRAIADSLDNSTNNPDISRLIASLHRDRPKCARDIPKWDLHLVLSQLTRTHPPPFWRKPVS